MVMIRRAKFRKLSGKNRENGISAKKHLSLSGNDSGPLILCLEERLWA